MKALAFRSINALFDGGNRIDRSCDMPTLRLYYVYTAPRDKTLRRSLCQHKEDGVIFPQASRYALSLYPSGPYCRRNDEVSHKLLYNVCLDSADMCYRMERRKCGTERHDARA